MNSFIIKKSILKGEISIPSSKSETLRAILFASLANGKSHIYSPLFANDTRQMIHACTLLGAKIQTYETHLEIDGINGQIETADDVIHAGNSGIVLRFLTAIAALSKHPIVITGDASIRHQRPMQTLLDGLSKLNVKAISTKNDGFAPIIVQGPLIGGKTEVKGHDSQPVSALLIASSFAKEPIEIEVKDPGEKPWIVLTLSWLDRLNISYTNQDFCKFKTFGNASYQGFSYQVPGDLSSAAFPTAAALVTNSSITLKNIDLDSKQGDKELIHVFQKMGAIIEINKENKTISVKKGAKLKGITVDINNFIDSVTILAVVACFAEGETHLTNCLVAKEKECDRLSAITKELKKMNANIEETINGLIVKKSELKGAVVFSHHDHRMCMSLAVAGFGATGETTILETACVQKTYPEFLNDLSQLNANIKME